jgi:hypothetical protein
MGSLGTIPFSSLFKFFPCFSRICYAIAVRGEVAEVVLASFGGPALAERETFFADTNWATGADLSRLNQKEKEPAMDTLTPELKQAVEQAGGSPVRLMDPETHQAYVLVNAEVYERLLLNDEDRREHAAFLRTAKKNARARLLEDS